MSDFPNAAAYTPANVLVSSLISPECMVAGGGSSASAVWPAANRALYIPFLVEGASTVARQMMLQVGTQSGNLDVGIYDEFGARLVSKGSTAVAAAGVQKVDITDTPLPPGQYYMAMSCDNVTAAFWRSASTDMLCLEALGLRQEALGSVTLPNPATFAAPAATYFPSLVVAFNATV